MHKICIYTCKFMHFYAFMCAYACIFVHVFMHADLSTYKYGAYDCIMHSTRAYEYAYVQILRIFMCTLCVYADLVIYACIFTCIYADPMHAHSHASVYVHLYMQIYVCIHFYACKCIHEYGYT